MQNALSELKPNSKKILLLSFFKVLAVVFLIAGAIFLIRVFVDFSIFTEVAAELGFGMDISSLFLPGFSFAAVIILLYLFLSYNQGNVSYAFYPDRMEIGNLTIPYGNIAKVTFEKLGMLNTGNITVELTGMEQKSVELRFIDNTQQVASDIMRLINQCKSRYYAQKSEEYKYDKILDKEGF